MTKKTDAQLLDALEKFRRTLREALEETFKYDKEPYDVVFDSIHPPRRGQF